jgi:hypothetical protein
MMLLVECGIDANDNVVPIVWALVPIENETWWTWFLGYLSTVSQYQRVKIISLSLIERREWLLQYLLYLTSQFVFIVASILQIIYSRDR